MTEKANTTIEFECADVWNTNGERFCAVTTNAGTLNIRLRKVQPPLGGPVAHELVSVSANPSPMATKQEADGLIVLAEMVRQSSHVSLERATRVLRVAIAPHEVGWAVEKLYGI